MESIATWPTAANPGPGFGERPLRSPGWLLTRDQLDIPDDMDGAEIKRAVAEIQRRREEVRNARCAYCQRFVMRSQLSLRSVKHQGEWIEVYQCRSCAHQEWLG